MKKKNCIIVLVICFLCSLNILNGQSAFATENKNNTEITQKIEQKKRHFWQRKQKEQTNVTQKIQPDLPFVPDISQNIQNQEILASPSQEQKLEYAKNEFENEVKAQLQNDNQQNKTQNKELTSYAGAKNVTIDSDVFEFFPERHEAIATGNVVVSIQNTNSKLFADKMVHNTDLNTIKGYGNVKMQKGSQIITGDFININLNEENVLVDKPFTEGTLYKLNAKEGFIYPEKIVAKDGPINVSGLGNRLMVAPGFGGLSFSPAHEQPQNFYEKEEVELKKKKTVIKAKTIYIKSLKEHDEVKIKNASYYIKNKKIFTIPSIDLTTNKAQDFIETNLPEMGSFKSYASYFGPGFVFNVAGGSTLKLAPVMQLGRKHAENDYGIGLLASFHSKNNLTEGMIGTVDDMWVGRGQHRLTDTLRLQYAHNAYMDEWFMGMRMPEYLLQLTDDRTKYIDDLDLTFRNKLSAGYVSDYYRNHTGTMRIRWQTGITKPLWSKWNNDGTVGINAGVIAQTSASVYGTGDFQGVVRGGPYLGTRVKNWSQTIAYFQTGIEGHSPMIFDQYMYGKCNLTIREALDVNKYLSVGYLGSLALLKDNWENKLFQENQFYFAVGPEDFKIAFSYDPIRKRSRVSYVLELKDRDLEVPFEQMIIDDADTLGREAKSSKKKKKRNEL